MDEFTLDARLQADCLPIARLELCDLLLMNDARWPWLILVPRVAGAVEIHLLSANEQELLADETSRVAAILSGVSSCETINSAALGNIVRQLHIHVVGRSEGDAGWPGPVWGHGQRLPYDRNDGAQLADAVRKELT
ncbi:MAG: HIT family protein [Rhizobiaceae bacterium]|nr:HIT family protein [Rhizobiaceae bacterium]